MKLNSIRRRACGLLGAMYIISIVANSVWMMMMVRHERKHQQQPKDYYSMTAGLIPGQCSGGSCSTPSYSSYSAPMYTTPEQDVTGGGSYAWDAFGPPWRLTQGGALIGTLYANGSFIGPTGDPIPCPAGWYPSGFDTTKLAPKVGGDKVGVLPATAPIITGDSEPKLFGIATKEQERAQLQSLTHYTITGSDGKVRDVTSNDAFRALTGESRLKSLYNGYTLAIIGVDAASRKAMVQAAKSALPAGAPVVVAEYDPAKPEDLWHIEGDWNHALTHRPTLAQSGAVAYVTNGPQETNKQNEVMAWSPDEVAKAVSSLTSSIRPRDGIPNHDPEKAKLNQPLFGMAGWPLTQYQTFAALLILTGAVLLFTPKPPAIEAQ